MRIGVRVVLLNKSIVCLIGPRVCYGGYHQLMKAEEWPRYRSFDDIDRPLH